MSSSLFEWVKGRQLTATYLKFKLIEFRLFDFGMDAYLLKIPGRAKVSPHRDPIENAKHYRMNIVYKGNPIFLCTNIKFKLFGNRIIIFRPDINTHSLITIEEVKMLSIGLAVFT